MAVAMIGPKFYAWDRNGKPLAFGKLYTYQARTNTPKDTYQSEDQVVPNTNPVILNGEGYANVYLTGSYKMVLKDDKDNEIWSSDPVTSAEATEWVNCQSAIYIGPKSFKMTGNFIEDYSIGRRVRIDNNTSSYAYSTIDSVSFSGGETFVNIKDNFITTGIQSVYTSIITPNSVETPEDLLITAEGTSEAITLSKRFSEVINVKDNGAKGDGVTDDTAAFLASNARAYYVTNGVFNVNSDISKAILEDDVRFVGNGNVSFVSNFVYPKCDTKKRALDDGNSINIGCFGDSTMWGATVGNLGAKDPNNQPETLQATLNLLYGSTNPVGNYAKSGTTIRQMLSGTDGSGKTFAARLDSDASSDEIIYCNHCINSVQLDDDIEQFKKDWITFVCTVRSRGKIPVIVTPNPIIPVQIGDNAESNRIGAYVSVMREVAEEYKVDLVDNFEYFKKSGELFPMTDLVGDGVHPLTLGYLQAGRNLAIPLVNAGTLRNAGDSVGIDSHTLFDNSSNDTRVQVDNRIGVTFLATREGSATGLNFGFILDKPQTNFGIISTKADYGAKVIPRIDGLPAIEALDQYNITGGNGDSHDEIAVRGVNLFAGLQVFGMNFDMTQVDGSRNTMTFAGISLPKYKDSFFNVAGTSKQLRDDVMAVNKSLHIPSIDLENDPLELYDNNGSLVQSVQLVGSSLTSKLYKNGVETDSIELSNVVSSGFLPVTIKWQPTTITVDVAILSGQHLVEADLRNATPKNKQLVHIQPLYR